AGRTFQTISLIDADIIGEHVELLTLIRSVRRIVTRTNRTMAILELEDLTGVKQCVLFPEAYERCSAHLVEYAAVEVRAKVDERNESLQLLVDELKPFEVEEASEIDPPTRVLLTISRGGSEQEETRMMTRLANLFREFPGDDEVYIRVALGQSQRVLRSGL